LPQFGALGNQPNHGHETDGDLEPNMTTSTEKRRRRATANLDNETWKRLDRIVKRDGLKPSEILKIAVADYLRKDELAYPLEPTVRDRPAPVNGYET
jgi:hypothetical protein